MMEVTDCDLEKAKKNNGLVDLIFTWSLRDVFDENLYCDKVRKIPLSFETVDQYMESYYFPLLEETRAELASAMQIIHRAPYAELVEVDEAKPYGKSVYDVKVNYWRNKCSDRGKEPYKTLPGDVIVLSDSKVETDTDLQREGATWAFATVINIKDDENGDDSTSTHFKVKVMKKFEEGDGLQTAQFVVFLMNITTNKRIWSAIHMHRNTSIIKEILCPDHLVHENCDLCSLDSVESESVDTCNLNESQTEAILVSLRKMECNHKSSLQLIRGPPGTGKTKTVSVLLYLLLKMNRRTLSCAPTNVAVIELASRVVKLMIEKSTIEDSIISFGDVLLFGNKDRLKVGSDIEDIYLDHRVRSLVECLGPLTGWKHCLTSMINLLEDCVSQYYIFVENEKIKAEALGGEEELKLEFDSFLEFLRARFKSTAFSLHQCITTFCTHLPRSYIQESNYENMVTVIRLLDSLNEMLFKDNVVSQELEKAFSDEEIVTNSYLSFLNLRRKSLSVLKALRVSLEGISLPSVLNESSIKEFCFQRASLIFCTVSSSYKLHSVPMEPLSLLLIDEAAQLKECESTIPLQLRGMRHAILIGDESQLPAMIVSNVCEEAGFGRSLFERLSLLGHSKQLLNVQYRMHPSISSFPNSKFYLNQILDAHNVKRKGYERHILPWPMFGPYSFINVVGGRDELDDVEYSRRNMVEIAVVMKIVHNLFKAWNYSKMKLSVGVVSPYAAQVAALQDKIGHKYEKIDGFSVKVKTIDGFQGGEEDIIIISTVRSNGSGSVGFLASFQRTNVSLTRARHALWILGNERTLANSQSVWEAVVSDAKDRGCFFNADEDENLAKAILDMKKELDQLDDLLKGDSTLFRNATWKVQFSDNFRKSFGKLRSIRTKKSVISLLVKLCSGWRPKSKSVDSLCERSSHVLKQFKVEGLYVVCSVDIVKDVQYTQVLKVWDLLPLEEIPKLMKRLDSIYSMHTDEFISCCNAKLSNGNLEIPMTWPTTCDIIRYKSQSNDEMGTESANPADGRSYVENSKVSESLLNMKFYSLSSGIVNHMLSDRDGRELELPFEVTDEEMEIIIFPRSSFILGRSGTGKTTVLTMKLFKKEQIQRMSTEGFYGQDCSNNEEQRNEIVECSGSEDVLRQLFVTVSPKLCYAVKQQVSQLKRFVSGGNYAAEKSSVDTDDITSEFGDIPDSFTSIQPEKYPLVITFFKFLMMLDGTVGNSFFERFRDISQVGVGKSRSSRSIALDIFIRTKEVTYERFCSSYWPHFNEQITKKLDPSRVFTEIISYIKGGLRAGGSHDVTLSREEYCSFSEHRASTLNRQIREKVYDVFQDYEERKQLCSEFDISDVVIDLHRRLKSERYMGDMVDFVYFDEVQDMTMRQISLFKYICRNYDEGFVFAGDTAQTIARGIDFRFQDIRSLFYEDFIMKSRSDSFGREEKGLVAEISKLKRNFRTHDGVLKLAHSVIELIYRFFRNTIDILEPETSLICGELPLLLEPGNDGDAIDTIFGNRGSSGGGKLVGFGAEQVILVRDDCARKEISSYVGKQALVLTVLECKGLEFQDVLLYNFFGSSPSKRNWRVVYEFMNEQNLLDDSCPVSFPTFNESKHNILCSDLKQLYVAITRTRQRLWICENTDEFSKPIFDYWRRKGLVQVRKLDNSLAQAMQVASSPEEWKARGIKLFRENNYEMATMCFERAGDPTWELRCKAFGHKANADRVRSTNPEQASQLLREAAQIFDSIGKFESAAECFCDLGEYEKAGNIYLNKCVACELKAAECFALAGRHDLAADVHAKKNNFLECLAACTKGKLFDKGLQFIEHWKNISKENVLVNRSKEIEKIEQEFLESCAQSNYDLKDNKSMMKFVRAFDSLDSKRRFLKSLKCMDELLLLEEESGNFLEAAEIARLRGDIILEANFLEKDGQFEYASLLILRFIFFNSLWTQGNRGWPLKHFPKKDEYLAKAKLLAKMHSESLYESVCTEVSVLSHERSKLFELKKYLKSSQDKRSRRGEILLIWKILDIILQFDATKYEWEDLLVELSKHYEEMIAQNRIPTDALVYFWNRWRGFVLDIAENISYLETQGVCKNMGYAEFCLDYFGVRRQLNDLDFVYVILCPNAIWVRKVEDRFLQKNGDLVFIDSKQFVSVVRSFWQAEMLSVGMKVLETLQSLYVHSMSFKSSLFCKSKCLLHIFEVAKCLLDCKLLECKYYNEKKLLGFIDQSTQYFGNVFPLDWRMSSTEYMNSLRQTDLSRNLLEHVILEIVSRKGGWTYGKIGRIVMIWLGSGRPIEMCDKIVKRFEEVPLWGAFIVNLGGKVKEDYLENSPARNSSDSAGEVDVYKFFKALENTYNANWTVADYMQPNCFLYLIDHLLMAIYQSDRHFFTTKSSFVEWLYYQYSSADSSSKLSARSQFPRGKIFDFVINVVHDLLLNKQMTTAWMKQSRIIAKVYYPLLVLKLFVILCLLCLNSRKYSEVLFGLLSRNDITCLLPWAFCDVLQRNMGPNFVNVSPFMLSDAFKRIGDPLVIVNLGQNRQNISCPDAIFVDLEVLKSREEIMRVLFPRKNRPTQNQNVNFKVGTSGGQDQSNSKEGKSSSVSSSSSAAVSHKDMNMLKGKDKKLQMNWEILGEISSSLESLDGKGEGPLVPLFKAARVEVEKNVNFLTSAITEGCKKEASDVGDELIEANIMLKELKLIFSLLSMSDDRAKSNISSIRELSYKVLGRRSKLDSFLNDVSLKITKVGGENDSKAEKTNNGNEVEMKEGIVACDSEDQSRIDNQANNESNKPKKGEANNESNNSKKGNGKSKKSKKGKGGKRK